MKIHQAQIQNKSNMGKSQKNLAGIFGFSHVTAMLLFLYNTHTQTFYPSFTLFTPAFNLNLSLNTNKCFSTEKHDRILKRTLNKVLVVDSFKLKKFQF